VVLVHLGSRPPVFVGRCAGQVRVVSGHPPLVVGPRTGARYRGDKLKRFRATEALSGMGPSGFWRYTCERFFVLEEYMLRTGLERCLHIESDVLIYVPPAAYDDWLRSTYGRAVAVCPLTEFEDTASVMYVGSREALSEFNDALLELVELAPERLIAVHGGLMANEMRMLRLLREQDLARALPTTIAEGELLQAPYLFDPASYGQWVGGTHAAPGIPYAGAHHAIGRELVDGRYEVFWDASRRSPFVRLTGVRDGRSWGLANLHIHSKRLIEWTPTTPGRERRRRLPARLRPRSVAVRARQALRRRLR
jgi:hypothetical protein